MKKLTDGPWELEKRYFGQDKRESYISSKYASPIFTILHYSPQREEVCNLIASAPEMLHAIEFTLDVLAINGDIENAKHWLRRAREKAYGRA